VHGVFRKLFRGGLSIFLKTYFATKNQKNRC
jgi:hypothetical protein